MSHYLFFICMNVLSTILNQRPNLFNFHRKYKALRITHLFFADDVLLFSRGDKDSISHLIASMDTFAKMSGLHVNPSKSFVFFCDCKDEVKQWFFQSFGFAGGTVPVKYLGVPFISSHLSIDHCMLLIERITARVNSWTSTLLSIAGRVHLTRTVLFSMQSFWTKHFLLPEATHRKIESILTRFIWKGDVNKSESARVSWSNSCVRKEEEALVLKTQKTGIKLNYCIFSV